MKVKRKGVLAALLATVAALGVGVSLAGTAAAAGQDGHDRLGLRQQGQHGALRRPGARRGQQRVKQINARGGVQVKIITCDTQNNNPAKAKSCALSLLGQGAQIIFTTCDVDYATPVVQEAINRGVLAVAPCIGTDQMGPKRFGAKGVLAFSFGNVAQDEGSAMAQYAWGKGWKTAGTAHEHAARLLQERRAGVRGPLQAARRQDRRPRDLRDRGQQRAGGRQPPERQEGRRLRDVDRVRRAPRVRARACARSATRRRSSTRGPATAPTGSAKDGVTNYYAVTYASAFGDDPRAGGQQARQGRSRPAPAASSPARPRSTASSPRSTRAGGSTNGAALAAQMVKFKKVPTLSGLVSFSPALHSVFGRQYRVIKISGTKAKVVGTVTAKVVPKI